MLVVTVLILAGLVIAGIGVAVWWLNDNISAPGPGATGSGACGSEDSVNIQLVYADGHAIQTCTRDRPDCPNQTISGTAGGETSSTSQFRLNNQLRSSGRRYILFIRFDGALSAETGEQTLQLDPLVGMPNLPGATSSGPPHKAALSVIPRDPDEDGYEAASGSLTVSSSGGVASGRIEGNFGPNGKASAPVRFAGIFACKH